VTGVDGGGGAAARQQERQGGGGAGDRAAARAEAEQRAAIDAARAKHRSFPFYNEIQPSPRSDVGERLS
jgi:hypothetical protein